MALAELATIAGLSELAGRVFGTVHKVSKVSLTNYTKKANVMSRLYIEDNILRDDICVPLVGTLNQLYVSYILSALNLDTMCANGRTVKEQFELVATENYDVIDEIMNNFGKTGCHYSNEDTVVRLEPDTQRLPVGRVIELTMTGVHVLNSTTTTNQGSRTTTTTHGPSTTTTDKGESQTYTTGPTTYSTKVDYDDQGRPVKTTTTTKVDDRKATTYAHTDTATTGQHTDTAVAGQSINTTTSQSDSTYQFKAYLFVQLVPYVLTPSVVAGYIGANFSPPVSRRWTQFKAGEISFWKDFILARDLIKKQSKILKQDKHGIILDMMAKQKASLFHWWEGVLNLFTSDSYGHNKYNIRSASHNLANTILISSKATFDRACREVGLNFANNTQRQKFFNKTWSMIVCVVDPLYNTVDMYFNGVNMKGTYNFAMINKVGAKGQDNFDLKEVMSAFSQGLTPKF